MHVHSTESRGIDQFLATLSNGAHVGAVWPRSFEPSFAVGEILVDAWPKEQQTAT